MSDTISIFKNLPKKNLKLLHENALISIATMRINNEVHCGESNAKCREANMIIMNVVHEMIESGHAISYDKEAHTAVGAFDGCKFELPIAFLDGGGSIVVSTVSRFT